MTKGFCSECGDPLDGPDDVGWCRACVEYERRFDYDESDEADLELQQALDEEER